MTDIHNCEKVGCTNSFDIDNKEGVIVMKIENKQIVKHYYCHFSHRP